jgi:hypothetical protein
MSQLNLHFQKGDNQLYGSGQIYRLLHKAKVFTGGKLWLGTTDYGLGRPCVLL